MSRPIQFKILVLFTLFTRICSVSDFPVLIIVSYDAFRSDFFHRGITPNLLELRKSGTYVDYMINVFPTKTFPNHHSIATGLFPESHGVIGNHIYDPKTAEFINYGYKLYHYNDDVLPIWALNEKMAEGRHSGIMMWPGGIFAYQEINSTYIEPWVSGFDFNQRIDTAIKWILDPNQPANLVMIYFEDPDQHAHIYGPNSDIVNDYIKRLDNVALYLNSKLRQNNLTDIVNVVHLSDHGISTVKPSRFINLTKFVNDPTTIVSGSTPDLHYIPDGNVDEIYHKLKKASKRAGHFTVYKKEELPERWHIKNNRRTPPIFVLADDLYGFQDMAVTVNKFASLYNITVTQNSEFGMHGYDNYQSNMWPFFFAYGPKIKENYKVLPFYSVDLFNLFCDILEIPPTPNNGTFKNVQDILATTEPPINSKHAQHIVIAVVVGVSLLMVAITTIVLLKHRKAVITTAALNKRSQPQDFYASQSEIQNLLENEEP